VKIQARKRRRRPMVSGSSIVIHPPPGCARAPARTALTPPSYGR